MFCWSTMRWKPQCRGPITFVADRLRRSLGRSPLPAGTVQEDRGHSYASIALAIILLAVILRIVLAALNVPETNSDEGTMGLEAMHIAFRGEHPVFLYGQDYMGVLEAYIAAFFFHLFGVSVFTLRIGMILMFTFFMVSMYFLVSLLYTKKLALLTLALLGLGVASDVLIQQLRAVGGAIETLLFGSLVLLLASWLALTSGQTLPPRTQRWRLVAYGSWGLAAGLGIWVHLLVLPFVLAGGLILLFFCHHDLRSWAPLLLLLGLLIGASPFIIYNIHVPLKYNTIIETLNIQSATNLAVHPGQHLLRLRVIGTTLWSLPIATGLTPVCALTDLPYYGPPTASTLPCIIVHGTWSLGYIALLTIASLLAIGALVKLWQLRSSRAHSWSPEERRAAVIHFARLMILFSAVLTLSLYVISPLSALKPWSTRYLVGLLIAVPAVLWPLWTGFLKLSSPKLFTRLLMVFKKGLLVIISLAILAGTVFTFASLPGVEADNQQQEALIQDLLRIGATRVYGEYWTCYRLMFQIQEGIICAIPYGLLAPGSDRYYPYYEIVNADPHAAYMFPEGSPDAIAFAKKIANSQQPYQRFDFDGYVVYQPE